LGIGDALQLSAGFECVARDLALRTKAKGVPGTDPFCATARRRECDYTVRLAPRGRGLGRGILPLG
jgi:hypothetical protein